MAEDLAFEERSFVNVCPWLLLIVMAKTTRNGNCLLLDDNFLHDVLHLLGLGL